MTDGPTGQLFGTYPIQNEKKDVNIQGGAMT